ncbi:hypothetical protein PI86_11005 [Burkholderia sp. A9]|nr:hypothetical protein PI86_11005 [Burkholderia sp. A9]
MKGIAGFFVVEESLSDGLLIGFPFMWILVFSSYASARRNAPTLNRTDRPNFLGWGRSPLFTLRSMDDREMPRSDSTTAGPTYASSVRSEKRGMAGVTRAGVRAFDTSVFLRESDAGCLCGRRQEVSRTLRGNLTIII